MEIDQAILALKDCEAKLQDLVSQAASAGDYDAVLRLTDWARRIAAMPTSPFPALTPSPNPSITNDRVSNGQMPSGKARRATRAKRSTQIKRRKYPKFARYRDQLVKIGWSKKEKTEYQHKAPREVVDALIDRITKVAASADLFTAEDIFPLPAIGGSPVPSYQAYLGLAWLRSIGFLNQHGRRGYSQNVATPKPMIEKEWASLPTA
jgi:hypothetical protein